MKIELSEIEVSLPNGRRLFRIPRFEVRSGEKLLIRGESGSGKTTLLHLIAGLFLPAHGNVQIGERSLVQMKDAERAQFRRHHIGIVFQKLNLLEHLTPIENVLLATDGQSGQRDEAIQALTAVGLGERLEVWSSQLSQGEQQRVAVARVLVAKAGVWLADEPTSSLDQANTDAILDLLLKSAPETTLVVVSHDHRIETRFDRVIDFASLVQP